MGGGEPVKVKRHKVDSRRHVLVSIDAGTSDDWTAGLDGAVVKFEVSSDANVDADTLRQKAIEAGAVHVYPIVIRRQKATHAEPAAVPSHDPHEAMAEYVRQHPAPSHVDPAELLAELL